jgi:hypothetical protein
MTTERRKIEQERDAAAGLRNAIAAGVDLAAVTLAHRRAILRGVSLSVVRAISSCVASAGGICISSSSSAAGRLNRKLFIARLSGGAVGWASG